MESVEAPCGEAPAPRLGAGKRWLFRLVVVAILSGVLELCSWYTSRALEGSAGPTAGAQQEPEEHGADAAEQARLGHYMIHPYLGYVLRPGFEQYVPQKNPITEYGFCDKGPPIHRRSAGKVIVGALGGSVASIFSEKGAEVLKQELRKDRRYRDKDVVIVNLAMYGHRQPQQVMSLNYALALGGEFDVILNIDGFNEIALYPFHNAKPGVSTLFPTQWHLHVAKVPDQEFRRLVGKITFLKHERARWARRFRKVPLRYSATAHLVWQARDRRLAAEVAECTEAAAVYKPRDLPPWAVGPRHRWSNEAEMYEELVSVWQRCSAQLDRECRAHGIRYYHFLQPNQYVPGSKGMGPEERKAAWLEHGLKTSVEKGYPLLKRAGKELAASGVRFRDLTMSFASTKEPLYWDTCCHFNEAGNEILARDIAVALLETPEPPRDEPVSGAARQGSGVSKRFRAAALPGRRIP